MLDLIEGNQSRFLHIDKKRSMEAIDPIIEKWQDSSVPVYLSCWIRGPDNSKLFLKIQIILAK